jgi:transposase
VAQIAREYGIHPGLPSQWRNELAENPEMAFSGNGNKYIEQITNKTELGMDFVRAEMV